MLNRLPLEGLRILSLAEQYPGPYATLLLADLGADVILVERPGSGDPIRRFPGLFTALHRNKRSVTLNLKAPADREEFLRLVDTADAVLEGFRPGVMARLGLAAEQLRARKPGLVFVSISSFGQTGPLATVAGHDLSIQGVAGMLAVPLGQEASHPIPKLPLADLAAGLFAALGIVTALLARERGASGSTIDVSMLDSVVSLMTGFLVPAMNGLPQRQLPPADPAYGVFATADGRQITLSIAGEPHMWSELCALLRLEQYADLSEEELALRREEILPVLRSAVASYPLDTLCAELEARRIAFGPVRRLEDVTADAQIAARGMEVEAAGQRFIRQPLLFDGNGGSVRRGPPGLGEHNEQLLGAR
jgi:crotonobetainyl-CoA:carnitine CoA-transferase CaiB-like acyl-CoA transferase